jgi:hypothetical protein
MQNGLHLHIGKLSEILKQAQQHHHRHNNTTTGTTTPISVVPEEGQSLVRKFAQFM